MNKTIALLIMLSLSCVAAAGRPAGAHADAKNGFSVQAPLGWGTAPLGGRIIWHAASKNGTTPPDCMVIVTKDSSFALMTTDQYIESQSEEKLKRVLALNSKNVKIGVWEPNFKLAGQKALHVVYSATYDGYKQTTFTTQTTRAGRLYTFSCNAPAEQFPLLYAELLQIADTFTFVPLQAD